MASNLSGCSYSELEESVRSKALIASQLLESMGQEPGPPNDYFERLSVALERRRAAVTQEQAEWQQKWLQLRDALQKAYELPQCTLPVDELCDIEAELVYAINSDRKLARRGVWNTADVQVKTNELIAALRIHWEPRKNPDSKIRESESTYSPVVSQTKSFTKNALSEEACSSFRDCIDSSSQKESELQEVSLIDTPKLPECSAQLYNTVRLISKSSWNIFSGAFIPNSIIVLEITSRKKRISLFSPRGTRKGTLRYINKGASPAKCNPHRVRYCPISKYLIIIDQFNKRVQQCVLSSSDSCYLVTFVRVPKGQLHDAISTGQQIFMCCPTAGIYSARLTNPSDVSECTSDVKLTFPIRLAWCCKSNILLVVDRLASNRYHIQGYRNTCNRLTAMSAPNIELASFIIPVVLINNRVVVIGWAPNSGAVISWLPTSATAMSDEICRIVSRTSDPTDMFFDPTQLIAEDYGEIIVCNKDGSIVRIHRPI